MNAIQKLRAFFESYCHFREPLISLPLAFWVLGTYLFERFDSYPYLIITARVKRAGKTRLSELMGFASNMPFNVSGASAPSLFRKIKDDKPTIIWDEAETLSSEANSLVRAFLNVGYRKGQMIPRATLSGVTEWPTYCPKIFVLIGDVYDTLRDRSMICEMERGTPGKRFNYETTRAEGLAIAEELRAVAEENAEAIEQSYAEIQLPFLTDRDEEIWRPIFAMCTVLAPSELKNMMRIAADLAAEKTNPHRYIPNEDSELRSALEEYATMAVRDMLVVSRTRPEIVREGKKGKKRVLKSMEALAALHDIPTSPWRKYYYAGGDRNKGSKAQPGLNANQLGILLGIHRVHSQLYRVADEVFRGYNVAEIEEAAERLGVA